MNLKLVMMRSACLIFSPTSGQSDIEQDLVTIQKILRPKLSLEICLTTLEVTAERLAQKALDRGFELIIGSGGDGTLSAIAGALIGTGIPLGVIPRGTANAFATSVGIPTKIEAACETILYGRPRRIDAAFCNGKPMISSVSIGFEAEAINKADRDSKNYLGKLAYIIADVQELSKGLRVFETGIEADNQVLILQTSAVTIANAAPFFSILAQGPPEVIADDGLLDITLVAPGSIPEAIASGFELFQSAIQGTPADHRSIAYLRAKRVKVTTEPPQKAVLDGDLLGIGSVEVKCSPGGLTVLVPVVSA